MRKALRIATAVVHVMQYSIAQHGQLRTQLRTFRHDLYREAWRAFQAPTLIAPVVLYLGATAPWMILGVCLALVHLPCGARTRVPPCLPPGLVRCLLF